MARRKRKKQTNIYMLIVIVCAIIAAYVIQEKESGINQDTESAYHKPNYPDAENDRRLEIPAPLTDRSERILYRTGYTVSYNSTNKIPNWVAWKLTPSKLIERESRTNEFLPDPDLPEKDAVTTNDYKGAGIDRGHMCPAGDNKWNKKAMIESFYMTNICPQNHNLNRGDWKELEEMCRDWARKEGKLYIVCGPILYKTKHRTIGKQKVVVPDAFFKVILVMGKRPRAIGFIYKNTSTNKSLDFYVNTIDEMERITAIDFFPALPDHIEDKVEAAYDLKDWIQ